MQIYNSASNLLMQETLKFVYNRMIFLLRNYLAEIRPNYGPGERTNAALNPILHS